MKKSRWITLILCSLMLVLALDCSAVTSASQKTANSTASAEKPMFAWIDDDGKAAVYTKLYPWALENEVPFTAAIISGVVDKKGYVTSQSITEMYESGYVRFADHTVDHIKLPTIAPSELEHQIGDAKTAIEAFGVPCDVMVYPGGQSNEDVIEVASRHFPLGFAAGGASTDTCRMNYVGENHIYQLKRLGISANSNIDFIKSQIDLCCSTGGVLVFMSHIGSTGSATGGASSDEDLLIYQQAVDYIREKGYDISTVMDACARLIEVESSNGDFITASKNTYLGTTPPSKFPADKVVINYVVNHTDGLPQNLRGILTTYNLGSNAYQTFVPSTQTKMYVRIRSSTEDKWLDWKDINNNYVIHLNNDKINAKTAPSNVPSQITVCLIASKDNLADLPEHQLGYLTTYKISTASGNARQEWQPVNSVIKYVREAKNSSEWGPWYKFEPVLVEP